MLTITFVYVHGIVVSLHLARYHQVRITHLGREIFSSALRIVVPVAPPVERRDDLECRRVLVAHPDCIEGIAATDFAHGGRR